MMRAVVLLASTSLATARMVVPDPKTFQKLAQANGGLPSEGKTTYDGVPVVDIPTTDLPLAQQAQAAPVNPVVQMRYATTADASQANTLAAPASQANAQGWTVTADSWQPGNEPQNAIDGNTGTMWHTPWGANGAPQPHWIQIDIQVAALVNSISYQPRQDGNYNGNIGGHRITLSVDGTTFTAPKALGTWIDDMTTKVAFFEATNARYIRLTSLTEAGNRGPWASAAEINIFTTTTPPARYYGYEGGEWSPTIDFPIVPVSAAVAYGSGNLVVWSAYAANHFGQGAAAQTLTATFNPASMVVSQRIVTNTQHDMFCEGLSLDHQGRFFSTGGDSASKTSIYTPSADAWSPGPDTRLPRGYAAQCTLSDGRTFLIGGSWSGGSGNKNGEVYSPATNTWTTLAGCPVAPMLTNDAQDVNGVYRGDNHAMLFGWKSGWVFQAGPSRAMNWYNPNNQGGQTGAGNRGTDTDAMCGNAVMYDAVAGKILVVGGARDYQGTTATANANIITLGTLGRAVQVQQINPMWYQRIFANGVALPNGCVFIVGGQTVGHPFYDDNSQLVPELWFPSTNQFIRVPPLAIPRNYHSVAVLLPDATVFSGGGGLCGDACLTNHYDGQVYSPYYLFNADSSRATRPVIKAAPQQIYPGNTMYVTVDTAGCTFSMVRMASTTHTVNTDQRRVPLQGQQTGQNSGGYSYQMAIPNDYGIVVPGYWYLFAMNGNGVPSIAAYVYVPAR